MITKKLQVACTTASLIFAFSFFLLIIYYRNEVMNVQNFFNISGAYCNPNYLISTSSTNSFAASNYSINNSIVVDNSTDQSLAAKLSPAPPVVLFRLFIGILMLPNNYDRRNLLRLVYGTQKPNYSQIDVRFVFCNLTTEEQGILISLEIMLYNDIIILNCTENMDEGKTYTYFTSLPDMLGSSTGARPPPYDYVMKADDDIFFRLDQLEEKFKDLPREDLYFGCVIPWWSNDPFNKWMSGQGYVLSWDLLEFIKTSSFAKTHMVGPEDILVSDWLNDGKVGNNRVNGKPAMYEYIHTKPWTPGTHELISDTLSVHRLKNLSSWVDTLRFFNMTRDLKPSRFYHIPY